MTLSWEQFIRFENKNTIHERKKLITDSQIKNV